jgi:hypothetical protein
MSEIDETYSEAKERAVLDELRNKVRSLELELRDTRDMARDTLHIAIGVDGKNGLRSAISELAGTVDRIKEDFMFLRETAQNYKELKTIIMKFLLTGVFAFIFQLGGIVWFFSSDHRAQEDMAQKMTEIANDLKQFQANERQKGSVK